MPGQHLGRAIAMANVIYIGSSKILLEEKRLKKEEEKNKDKNIKLNKTIYSSPSSCDS